MLQERKARALNGFPALFVLVAATVVPAVALPYNVAGLGSQISSAPRFVHPGIIVYGVLIALGWAGLTIANRNEARALVLFGRYAGSMKSQGFLWVNPFTRRQRISINMRNFETVVNTGTLYQ